MEPKLKRIFKSFGIRLVLLFIGWLIIYQGFIKPNGSTNEWLTSKVVQCTKIGLKTLGYNTTHGWKYGEGDGTSRYIYIDEQPVVLVADACNGLELIALYIGFLLSFPGSWKWKSMFISVGTLIIFTLNVIREMVLALNYKYFQETFDFNHKYTYVFIVYLVIFLIWRFWLNRWSEIGKNHKNVK